MRMSPVPRTAAVILAFAATVPPCSAETFISRFDGRWKNLSGEASLRWIDLRIGESSGPIVRAWWSCGVPDGCLYEGPVHFSGDGQFNVTYHAQDWKSLLQMAQSQDGLLLIREQISYRDGRGNSAFHRLQRVSDAAVRGYAQAVQIGGGQTIVQSADGNVYHVRPPNPGNQQPRRGRPRDAAPGTERLGRPMDIRKLEPPYNPEDPNMQWLSQYNVLLWQILSYLVRPDQLDAFARMETANPYDQFVRRSEFIDFLTMRR